MPETAELAGKWRVSGHQAHVQNSAWSGEMELKASGVATLRLQQGLYLNKRSGRWSVRGSQFELTYTAPEVGQVRWTSSAATPRAMSGDYRTPKAGPPPVGWGGNWSAIRTA